MSDQSLLGQENMEKKSDREMRETSCMMIVGTLGKGSSSIVRLGEILQEDGSTTMMAIKSVEMGYSMTLEEERIILKKLEGCPEIIRCFGTSRMFESSDGYTQPVYGMYLEYTPHGSIYHLLRKSGPLEEERVRAYTRSMLKGLAHIHRKKFVHCDIKPANILVWSESDVKIADFGLAKRVRKPKEGFGPYNIRCTPLYTAPECVTRNEYEPPMDVWALGCVVAEMITGKHAVKFDTDQLGTGALLAAIAEGRAQPEIPEEKLSEEGKDFLRKCFVRDPASRWTAEMLLKHPFASDEYGDFPHTNLIYKLLDDDDGDELWELDYEAY